MKKLLLFTLMVLGTSAQAQDSGKLNITPFLERLNICSVITHKQDILAGGCFSAASWAWGSANVGVTWDTNDKGEGQKGVGGVIMAVGIRADKAFGFLWRKSGLEKRGVVLHFVVPQFEVGPMGGYNNQLGWIYGGFLNVKIPFGK